MRLSTRSTLADFRRSVAVRDGNLVVRGRAMALLSPVRHAAFALFFVAILAYGASFAWHLLINFTLLDLIYEVNSDDSFYYFKIAQHLAEGKFSTFDGGITRTNGYHPIWPAARRSLLWRRGWRICPGFC